MSGEAVRIPTLGDIEEAMGRLAGRVLRTPVWQWRGREIEDVVGADTRVFLKLELFQFSGSFKPRGALLNLLVLEKEQLARGVTAVSAGNHAMAVGYAARVLGSRAKVVMPETANPARVAGCRAFGAEVVVVGDVHEAFVEARRIEREEGLIFIHPFEGFETSLGSATLAYEFHHQVEKLDAIIVPIGGGGLCAGVAAATKLLDSRCRVIGVEPLGADTMHRSFAAGRPVAIDRVETIADSLGAPHSEPYSFALCRRFVDELVLIDDEAMRGSMRLLFDAMKLAVEPAGSAATAALCGPLRDKLRGLRVGIIVCGSNIDAESFHKLLA